MVAVAAVLGRSGSLLREVDVVLWGVDLLGVVLWLVVLRGVIFWIIQRHIHVVRA